MMVHNKIVKKYMVLVAVLAIIDRVFKYWALTACQKTVSFCRYFSCKLVFNRGVSWSLFNFSSDVLFWILTAVISSIIVYLMQYTYVRYCNGKAIIGELFVIIGAVSNVVDRLVYRGVIDFFVLSYNGYTWPVFNGADCYIIIGVAMMLYCQYKES